MEGSNKQQKIKILVKMTIRNFLNSDLAKRKAKKSIVIYQIKKIMMIVVKVTALEMKHKNLYTKNANITISKI